MSPAVAADGKLSAADIQKQVIGKKWASKTKSGKPFTVVWKKGGGGTMTITGIGNFPAKWHTEGNNMCWTIPKQPVECSSVTAKGSSLVFMDAKSGKVNNTYVAM